MAISGNLNNRNKPRSPILLISVSAAAITLLFIFYSSSSSLLEFSFSSPKALKNLLRDRKQRDSLDKYLYWGDRIDCPGKHCDSCEGLGHQESSLRCALEEALFIQSYKLAYLSNYSSIIDPVVESNYQLFMTERLILMGAKTFVRTFKEDETDLSLTDDPRKNTKKWQIPAYSLDDSEGT